MNEESIQTVITDASAIADGVRLLTLARPDGGDLPRWAPGAHIDLLLEDGITRQYSLCGDPQRPGVWQIAVLRESDSRGGSVYLHETAACGDRLRIRGPRNTFRFEAADEYVFIAGGIGITPLRPMIAAADAAGSPWRLHYAARSRGSMAFADELSERFGDRIALCCSDDGTRMDVEEIVGQAPPGARIYCCGPERLIDAVEAAGVTRSPGSVQVERFHPRETADLPETSAFVVELAQSGLELDVAADRSVLDVVREGGVDVESSCEEGTCGTCETDVIDGEPDHRDSVLSEFERECGDTMMICVSRARSGRLVLDL